MATRGWGSATRFEPYTGGPEDGKTSENQEKKKTRIIEGRPNSTPWEDQKFLGRPNILGKTGNVFGKPKNSWKDKKKRKKGAT